MVCTKMSDTCGIFVSFTQKGQKEKKIRGEIGEHIKWGNTCPGRSHNCTHHRHERGYMDAHKSHR
jgi:hypothetical protein